MIPERLRGRWSAAIAAALAVATFAAYAGAIGNDFVSYDDEKYVTANAVVSGGLTIEGIRWAFTTGHASNWHPLTWLSHMLDVQIFGLHPSGHHLTSILLHGANTLLLFGLLSSMTGAVGRSGLVAALFGLHPVHVESVAWVAERKDVLSAFFALWTLIAYVAYARRPGPARYAAVTVLYGAGLLAKPMVVTLPFVMLLLDHWPLGRLRSAVDGAGAVPRRANLLGEKLPWILLAAISCAVTLRVQTKSVAPEGVISIAGRAANAMISYARYLWKIAWPSGLTAFYPHPLAWPLAAVLGSAALVLGVTAVSLRLARKRPYLLTGWLWYVGTLVPVIGLVQVGSQSIADRYTYLPSIGIFVMAVWACGDLTRERKLSPMFWAGPALAACAVLGALTLRQVTYWKDPIEIWTHAIHVDAGNALAWNYLAYARWAAGDLDGAIADYGEAIRLRPSFPEAYRDRGAVRQRKGDQEGALRDYNRAIELRPGYADAFNNRGLLRRDIGDLEGAIADYEAALARDPGFAEARNNLGLARLQQGDVARALAEFDEVLRIRPSMAEAYNNRAQARRQAGDLRAAGADLDAAIRLRPRFGEAIFNRAILRKLAGDLQGAEADYSAALAIDPGNAPAYVNRAILRVERHDLPGAIADLDRAIARAPGFANAWLNRGVARQLRGDLDGSITDCGKALEIDAGLAEAYLCRAEARRLRGDEAGQAKDLAKAREIAERGGAAPAR